jgi:hypothetical protein
MTLEAILETVASTPRLGRMTQEYTGILRKTTDASGGDVRS